jgi:hypothetical protein
MPTGKARSSAQSRPARASFDYGLDYERLDLRAHPELYRVGVGEQGVLRVQPYKRELLPHWRFRTPELARASSDTIYALFLEYLREGDFVGADMARKFLQMGFTRARRYANHRGGRKYDGPVPAEKKCQSGAHGRDELPRRALGESTEQRDKAAAAEIFKARWDQARANPEYQQLRAEHQRKYG